MSKGGRKKNVPEVQKGGSFWEKAHNVFLLIVEIAALAASLIAIYQFFFGGK